MELVKQNAVNCLNVFAVQTQKSYFVPILKHISTLITSLSRSNTDRSHSTNFLHLGLIDMSKSTSI